MKKTIFSSLLLVSVLVACGSQVVEFPVDPVPAVEDPPAPTDPVPNEQCVDANCPVGQVCQNNVCTQVDPCAGVVCPEGEVCKDGACTSTDPCAGVTCPEGVQCVDGACPPPPDPCANGACPPDAGPPDSGPPKDPCEGVCCPHNKECKEGSCVPKDPCAGVQCPESRVCKDGACVCDGSPPKDDGCGHGKTKMCHRTCKGKRVNICVRDCDVASHKRRGDKVGDCSHCK